MKLLELLPSILSILRIVMALALFYTYLSELMLPSIIIFIIAISTDYMDGFIARKFDVTTNYGAFLDSAADFILIILIFLAFIISGIYPFWILILIIFMYIQFILTSGTKKPIYDPIGKYYGVFLFLSAGITLILPFILPTSYVTNILLIIIVLFSLISLLTRFYSLYKKN